MMDKSAIQIRPFTPEDDDQVHQILLTGFKPVGVRYFHQQAKAPQNILSIFLQSIVYTSLIELGLTAYRSTSSSSASFSFQDLEVLKQTLMQPETAQEMIVKFLNPSFILLWVVVTMVVAVVQLKRLHMNLTAGTEVYIEASLKDDLADIPAYYQKGRQSTKGNNNNKQIVKDRSQFWVACLASHPQLVLGCIALEDLDAHKDHLKLIHEKQTERGPFNAPSKEEGELRRMSVHPDYRRLGIGKLLLQTLREDAKAQGFKRVILTTTTYQWEAIAGYVKFGFQKDKVLSVDNNFFIWCGHVDL